VTNLFWHSQHRTPDFPAHSSMRIS
jgi:hypothetical protein